MLEAFVLDLRMAAEERFNWLFTCFVCTIISAAFVNDQPSLEELEKARRLLPLTHQHLNRQPGTQ